MILKQTLAALRTALKNFHLPFSRVNRNKVLWQPKQNSYGKSRRIGAAWLISLKKKLSSLTLFLKGGRHLSRIEKRKIVRAKVLKALAALSIVLLLMIGLKNPVQDYAASLELFKIQDISISGCQITRPVELKTMAGFDYNTSLFSATPEKVSAALVKHPWIKSTRVTRQWPDGISIEVDEHSIKALLALGPAEEEKFYYINNKGETIAPVQVGQDIDYPVITGMNILSEKERSVPLKDAVTFLKLIGSNDPNLPAQSVSEIHVDMMDGMIVHLVEFPFPIYFGKGEVKKKYKQLRKVLAVLYRKRNKNIDISQIEYIRMDYHDNKVLIAQAKSG
jgi:cell division septal protein FtsQ